jgi:predicted GNAT family N-acyltransferase
MKPSIELKEINVSSKLYGKSLMLRNEVLREPLGLNIFDEDLSQEHVQRHFIATFEDSVIGVVIMAPTEKEDVVKLRQMAVSFHFQGQGIGAKLVLFFEKKAKDSNIKQIKLHAREVALEFYKNLGYNVCSDRFLEVNIPHFQMEKVLG